MKRTPKIGERVEYRVRDRRCVGVVGRIFPGGERHKCEATGEEWVSETAVMVVVDDPLPVWWPYIGTNRFAPVISNVYPIAKGGAR